MTERGGLGRSLTSILTETRDIRDEDTRDEAATESSLEVAYRTLRRLATARHLTDAVVVVDDPDLGRQLLAAGRRPLTAADELAVEGPSGCRTEPPAGANDVERELVHQLCATALRAAVHEPEPAAATDALELALRALPGVYAVALDDEDPVVEVHASAEAEPDLARRAGSLARRYRDDIVTVDLIRRSPRPSPDLVVIEADPTDANPTDAEPADEPLRLRTVTLPGHRLIEVIVERGATRRVGRAPRARGLLGAVEAALDALGSGGDAPLDARTIRTAADGGCVVAVTLMTSGGRTREGRGSGANPIEAAAAAALDAVTGATPDAGTRRGEDPWPEPSATGA